MRDSPASVGDVAGVWVVFAAAGRSLVAGSVWARWGYRYPGATPAIDDDDAGEDHPDGCGVHEWRQEQHRWYEKGEGE
jgi:hypothetical protein